jgi:RHS repeat-associated protein
VTYTYDNNGNMLTSVSGANTTHYTWDFENRLTSVQLPGSGGTINFKYDPFGRRVEKVSSSATSIYIYDGDNLVEETNSAGTAVARYTQTQNIDEPLAMLRGSTTSYYSADGLGSITSLTNTSGANAQTYTYDSFGNLTASSGSLTNSFRYTGREFDTETSLYYYRARYYDATVGRFLGEDPIHFIAGVNFYPYVGNSPTNGLDPSGLAPKPGQNCGITKCFGVAYFTAVRNDQAPAGALRPYGIPAKTGTVAVDPRDFGLPYPRGNSRSANEGKAAIQALLAYEYPGLVVIPGDGSGITPPDAPNPPYPVSDIIDPRVLNHPRSVPTIDIYRVPTNAAANKLTGLHYTWILFPAGSPFDCPAGFVKNPVGIAGP